MDFTEKELLEIFSNGLEAIAERRQLNYNVYKEIQKLLSKNKITIKLKIKLIVWCTKCDVNMIEEGIAMDSPNDGTFYACPTCNYRIVVF